jgi:hypothetical protein
LLPGFSVARLRRPSNRFCANLFRESPGALVGIVGGLALQLALGLVPEFVFAPGAYAVSLLLVERLLGLFKPKLLKLRWLALGVLCCAQIQMLEAISPSRRAVNSLPRSAVEATQLLEVGNEPGPGRLPSQFFARLLT